jgi:glycerol-3-phosphate dehydrogenase (NAD(P)+)
MKQITVLGAGSWGTALAVHLGAVDHEVRLWGRDESLTDQLRERRVNAAYLPGVVLPSCVAPTHDLGQALDGSGVVVAAIPSHGLRAAMRSVAGLLEPGAIMVSATKGLEEGTLLRMSEVVQQELGSGHPVVVLSGPSFAAEVARQRPTAVLAASSDPRAVSTVQKEFRGPAFRLYASDDVVGVEIGGALKNVIAIAAGVVESLGLGHNALAALITRGLAEISRLAGVMGAQRETLAGLSGLGDLVLTCTGSLSRNRQVGLELGKGRKLPDVLAGMRMVAEGVRTTHAALVLGQRRGVELPIAKKMDEVMTDGKDPREAVRELMLRPQRSETE